MKELKESFRPEFLNRVDDIVLFKPLRKDEIRRIVKLMLDLLSSRLKERDVKLIFSDEAVEQIAEAGYDPVYGARPLKRYIVRQVETKLARAIIAGKVQDGTDIKVGVKDGELSFSYE